MDDLVEAARILENVIQNVNAIFNDDISSSSEDEDDEDVMLDQLFHPRDDLNQPVRIEGYIELLVPRFTNDVFQSHFRLTLPAYEALEHAIGLIILRDQGNLELIGQPLPIEKQILSV